MTSGPAPALATDAAPAPDLIRGLWPCLPHEVPGQARDAVRA